MNENLGTLYFFTGLSGAGKTTLGSLFHERLKNSKPNVVYLDGDLLRPVFCEDTGYSSQDRLKRAQRIFRVCKMLTDQGIDVVCCSIAMIESVRLWNRKNIPSYKEIYVRVTAETLIKRDQKNLYTKGKNVVGIDLPFDEPKESDIIIDNNGDRTPLEIISELESRLFPQVVRDEVDNTIYWDMYYRNKMAKTEASPFGKYALTLFEKGKNVLELGCGNGRDSLYFAEQGMWVTALDTSKVAIDFLNINSPQNAKFICKDFVSFNYEENSFDYVYSRFTLHSITKKQENILFNGIKNALKNDGKLLIEVRGTKDKLFGVGKALGDNAFFYDNHYRRFANFKELCEKLSYFGFTIEYAKEDKGFAPYGNEDPVVIRLVAVCRK